MPSTIRTVSSFEGARSDTSSDTPSVATKNSAFSTSVNSNTSAVTTAGASHTEDDRMSTVRLKSDQSRACDTSMNGHTPTRLRAGSTEQCQAGSRQQQQQQQSHRQVEESLGQPPSPPIITHTPDATDATSPAPDAQDPNQTWDSTIGKAGLGKTGRVINKLVSDNEALKRDIKIERLKAEEAKQASKLTEDKMERLRTGLREPAPRGQRDQDAPRRQGAPGGVPDGVGRARAREDGGGPRARADVAQRDGGGQVGGQGQGRRGDGARAAHGGRTTPSRRTGGIRARR